MEDDMKKYEEAMDANLANLSYLFYEWLSINKDMPEVKDDNEFVSAILWVVHQRISGGTKEAGVTELIDKLQEIMERRQNGDVQE